MCVSTSKITHFEHFMVCLSKYANLNKLLLLARYGLFAALSVIMKNEISPYLEVLVTFMMASLKSTEGVQVMQLF